MSTTDNPSESDTGRTEPSAISQPPSVPADAAPTPGGADASARPDGSNDTDADAGVASPAPGSFAAVDIALAGALSADSMGGAPAEAVRPRRRLAMVLSAAAVVVAVLAAGGAYAVMQRWQKPSGALPEDRMPASVVAFARVNLTPGLQQRLKFEELLRKSKATSGQQLEDVKRELFEQLQAPITYADIAAWFDDRIGVAMWAAPGRPSQPVTLVVASARDDGKARAALTTAQQKRGTDRLGFVVEDGYALIAIGQLDAQGSATAAAAEARRAPLAKDAGFRSAIATLPGDQAAIGWADLAKVSKLDPELHEVYPGELDPQNGPPPGATPGAGASGAQGADATPGAEATYSVPVAGPGLDITGVAVVGVRASDDSLEATVRVIGAGGLPLGTDAGRTDVVNALGALSGDAQSAGVLSGPLGDLEPLLGPEPGYLPLDLLGMADVGMAPPIDALPPGLAAGDEEAFKKYVAEHPEIFGELGKNGEVEIIRREGVPALTNVVDPRKLAASLASGLSSAQTVSFTLAGELDGETAAGPLLLDLKMADAAAAARTQQELSDLTKISKATCEQHDEHVVVRSSTYAGGTSRLADNALFQRAMAGAVERPVAALYFTGATLGVPARAVGVTAAHEGADAVLHVRLVMA
ncbi:hypothetical protein [Dactylosporangium sp. CA-233914]|uniref:hypothetical protein n=1 Tax=Dactylosporangium sp. CA-233914 TaxID=3239934 RepID=UPI003D8E1551